MFNRLTKQRCLLRIAIFGALLVYNFAHPVDLWYNVALGAIVLYYVVRLIGFIKDENKAG
jgi:membrane protein YdbS with pleckstrin-like domain